MRLALPIDAHLPALVAALRAAPNAVVVAEPGAGKTTRVPPALLDEAGEVWVLEPRRLAARLAARRVAEELGEKLGETVGYQVRFEDVSGPRTRLRFLTEGVLTRRLLSDPTLKKVRAVVLDEFHERHLQTDVALAWLRRLQLNERPDLRLVVMSATLDAEAVAQFLGGFVAPPSGGFGLGESLPPEGGATNAGPVFRVAGRQFPVAIEHLARPDARPLEKQVAAALRRLDAASDVLVFLPGAAEIRKAAAELAQFGDWLVLPLHGELSAAEQDRAVRPAERRKVILSTNVAESSVTIEGVGAVIDAGLARVAGHAAWTGLRTLKISRISRAAAAQRAGRAGRTNAGRCLRLYTEQDFKARPAFETPELLRLDLAETVLSLHAAGVADARDFNWFDAPPEHALVAAETLLQKLGALNPQGGLSDAGRRMLRFPLHPRLSRVVVETERRGLAAAGCLLAALLNERDPRRRDFLDAAPRQAERHGPSDVLELFDLFHEAERAGFAPAALRRLGLDEGATRAIERTRRQLVRLCGAKDGSCSENELLRALLAGFPDRVARRRANKSGELLLCGGGAAQLAAESVAQREEFVVALDAEERAGLPLVRRASRVEPEWLIDFFADQISERTETVWNTNSERVEAFSRWYYGHIVIDESRAQAVGAEVSGKLAEMASAKGWAAFAEREAVERWLARVNFVAREFPESHLPALGERAAEDALRAMCAGRRSFAELREAARNGEFFLRLQQNLDAAQLRLVAQMAPERVLLKDGRQARVNYEADQPPWIASRLQDFFGLTETPRVAGGRVALVAHLLAPSRRPVQVTHDLAGFWTRHYPAIRRELARRYPKHAWPEKPV
jgi:ATP-dependent helicase HrpB